MITGFFTGFSSAYVPGVSTCAKCRRVLVDEAPSPCGRCRNTLCGNCCEGKAVCPPEAAARIAEWRRERAAQTSVSSPVPGPRGAA